MNHELHERIEKLEREFRWLKEEFYFLRRIIHRILEIDHIASFNVTREGDPMALPPIVAGSTVVYTATPVPSTSVPSTPPTWTSSDPANAPVTADPTGLIGTVVIAAVAPVGTSYTVTISYTNADGSVATGSASDTTVAPPSPDITSFDVVRTA